MFRRRDADDFAAEVASHLEFEIERLQGEGLSADEARAAARRTFGNLTLSREQFSERRHWRAWDGIVQDARHAVRTWRNAPGFALVSVLTIALGIGATTAIFSVVDVTLLQPLPYPRAEALVSVVDDLPGTGSYDVGLSQPEWLDLDRSGIFENVALAWFDENNLTSASRPAQVRLMSVTPNYFAVLGVAPQLGRVFPADNRSPGYTEEVVISDGLWKRDFGGDAHILDRSIRLDTDLYRVVAVMPPGFHAPGRTAEERDVDVWAATSFYGPPLPIEPPRRLRNIPGAIARLPPGVSTPAAQQQIDALVASLRKQYSADYPDGSAWTVRLVSLQDTVVGDVRPSLILMLCAVGLVLVIGCVNVANLLLARASTRRREFSIRAAIGAGRARLMRQLLTESLCLATAGGAVAVVVLVITRAWLIRLIPADLPRVRALTLDWNVLLFAVAMTIVSGVVFGLAPALDAGRRNLRSASAPYRQARTGHLLVAAEVALSLVLMVAAGLLMRSFWDLLNARLGFNPTAVTTVRTRLPYPNDTSIDAYRTIGQEAPFVRELLRRTQALPDVTAAAVGSSSAIPLDHAHRDMNVMPMLVEGRGTDATEAPIVDGAVVTPGYFPLLGMPLVRGRLFNDFDVGTTPAVAVINEAMARAFWPKADPIGAHVKLSGSATAWTTVVGIVADARTETLADADVPQIYASSYQKTAKHLAIFLRGPTDTAAAADRVREIVQQLDPALPVFGARRLPDEIAASVAGRRFVLQIIAVFGLTALVLSALGIYGVMSYTVAAQTHEIGVRLALGAPRTTILAGIMGRGLVVTAAGTVAGAVCAAMVARLMAATLYGVPPFDPLTFAAVTIVLLGVAVVACLIPARRATRIDPLTALRSE
ncbi:MAG TPA: ABC transporter permease [Vicinamibacterales bacterium]